MWPYLSQMSVNQKNKGFLMKFEFFKNNFEVHNYHITIYSIPNTTLIKASKTSRLIIVLTLFFVKHNYSTKSSKKMPSYNKFRCFLDQIQKKVSLTFTFERLVIVLLMCWFVVKTNWQNIRNILKVSNYQGSKILDASYKYLLQRFF